MPRWPLARATLATPLLAGVLISAGLCAGASRARAADAPVVARLLPDPSRLAEAPPDLLARLAASPVAYFRFVNQAWTHEVCAAFAADVGTLPISHLHGDAHVEQYAVTDSARGLDDFDDSARGPAVVDIVRFLGSLELTAAERGWQASLPSMAAAFFAGYRRALEDPRYLPPDPAVVARLRAGPTRSKAEFLAWADSLMLPLAAAESADVTAVWPRIEHFAAGLNLGITPAFLHRKRQGWLHMGIGSALSRKLLLRVEGPTPAVDDDVVLEAKEVLTLREESCLSLPRSPEVFRVIEGAEQVGRLDHKLLVALPLLSRRLPDSRGWWVRAWDRSYRELEIANLASAEELTEIAHDVGAQLGRVTLVAIPGVAQDSERRTQVEGLARLEPRLRQVAHDLTNALLEGWRTLGRQ
jgi:hypothetical protein